MRPDNGLGPPEKERPGATPDTRPHQTTTCTVDTAETTAVAQQGRGVALLAQLRRRHEAAKRLPRLPHNGRRDVLTPRERADGWARP